MKLKVTLNSAPALIDVVITCDAAATVEDVARAIRLADPRQPPVRARDLPRLTLAVTAPSFGHEVQLPPDKPLSEASIGAGYRVRVAVPEPERTDPRGVAAVLRVLRGPDEGAEFPLRYGDSVLGRDAGADVRLRDPLVSGRHARITIGNVVELVDLNSANGLLVDGGVVARVVLEPGRSVLIGGSEVAVALTAPSRGTVAEVGGSRPFLRRPRVVARFAGEALTPPQLPTPRDPAKFPALSLAMPMVMGIAMFAVTRSPFSLLFVVMGPAMMVGSWNDNRRTRKRQLADEAGRFEDGFGRLTSDLAAKRPDEIDVRLQETPAAADVMADAHRLGDLLWSRRPEHWNFGAVRLGLGTAPSRTTVLVEADSGRGMPEFASRVRALAEHYRDVGGVPLAEHPSEAGAIGIAGDRTAAADLARALLVQLAGLHSPAELVITAVVGPRTSPDFDWLTWLPHTSSPQSPLGDGLHLADSAATCGALVAALESLVQSRRGRLKTKRGAQDERSTVAMRGAGAEDEEDGFSTELLPAVVVLISADAPASVGRLVQLAEDAADAGVFPIWLADDVARLPAVCRTFVDVGDGRGDAEVGYVRLGRHVRGASERVTHEDATAFARRLASIMDAGAVAVDASDLPQSVTMLSLLGTGLADSPAAAVDRWQQNGSIHDRTGSGSPAGAGRATLRAIVGQSAGDALRLDLRSQGPHALVGGTTGAGKSEFLQAWVLGMAAEYSPDRVTFLFVDYKGGSAFAECTSLPHAVGIVTDLTPYLVRRALTSLRAELHHRELLLSRKKAKDLLELERRGDLEAPPALVLVIDEFAALVGDVPEFVDGVVDIAQRGRSLGIHLIMATQRPAGVIKDNLRANTNLRVALRMADANDSTDVVGESVAAGFDPGLPGRGVARTGPGRLLPFQSAYAGGVTGVAPERAAVQVAELRFGAEVQWQVPADETREVRAGATDLSRLVGAFVAAAEAASIPAPRRPWLDQLPDVLDLAGLEQGSDTQLRYGITDVPERQARRPAIFEPDAAGHLGVFGASGTGKSALLRTLAVAAASADEPVHVYGLDFAGGALRMLSALPNVGAVIPGDDIERGSRLIGTLRALLDERSVLFSQVNASTITEYRALTGRREPRVLLLVDNFQAFRDAFDTTATSAGYTTLLRILSEGRQFGVHLVLTADRAGAIPTAVLAGVQERVVLRLADDSTYLVLGAPNDVLTAASPPGRALVDGHETQIGIPGGSANVVEQSNALDVLAAALRGAPDPVVAPPVRSLPTEISPDDLPSRVGGRPVLGVSDDDLQPVGFDPVGAFVIAGGPGSGRTTALISIARAIHRFDRDTELYYLGRRRSVVRGAVPWTQEATSPEEVQALAKALAARVAAGPPGENGAPRIVAVIEGISDFLSGPADPAIVELIKASKRNEHLVVAESESSTWTSSWPLLAEMKSARRGIVLQPDPIEGDTILRTTFPRVARASFPVGRGFAALGRGIVRVQLPLAETVTPDPAPAPAPSTEAALEVS